MSDEKELRAALEKAQHDNKLLTGQLAELRAFAPQELLERIHTLEKQSSDLRARLETADLVRAEWDARMNGLRRELDIARAEQERLRNLLENERLSR